MKKYIAVEKQTDGGGYIEVVSELIQCKDCKHCYQTDGNVIYNCCELNRNVVQPNDWYCADGERKEE